MIARAVPEEVTASAQGVLRWSLGLLTALAMLASGPLYQTFGGDAFAVMAVLPAIALVILAVARRRHGVAAVTRA